MAGRLQRAALELFQERGYDRTTATEIAARAGVTERTFFRYYVDKREVLFGGQPLVTAALIAAIGDAPTELGPLETLVRAFCFMLPGLEANRSWLVQRHRIISATPALHEREAAKMLALGDALADALKARGIAELRAILAARIGIAALAHVASSWLSDPTINLGELIERTFHEVRSLLA